MKKGDKGKKVFGVIVILAIIVSVFGGVVSAEDLSGGLKQSVDDAGIQTAVDNLSSEELTEALDDDPLHQLPSTSGKAHYAVADGYAWSGGTESSSGAISTSDKLRVGFSTAYGNYRTLIKFDMSSIPAGATITSADLKLYYYAYVGTVGDPLDISVYRTTVDWDEGHLSWSKAENYNSFSYDTVTIIVGSGAGYKTWDITALVQNWVDGTYSNYGVLLRAPTQSGSSIYRTFRSKEYGSNVPKLEVTYTTEQELLPAPTLISPYNGETDVSTTPYFDWSSVSGATHYWLMVAENENDLPDDPNAETCPNCVICEESLTSTSYTPSTALAEGTTYYWQVQAYEWGGSSVTRQGQFSELYKFKTKTTPVQTRVKGIDAGISAAKDINWHQVYNAGYRFALLKATEGINWPSPEDSPDLYNTVKENVKEARDAGLLVGVYHFGRPVPNKDKAKEEAESFVRLAGDYIKEGYLRPALDIEDSDYYGEYPEQLGKEKLAQWIKEWMDTVEARTGVKPILYMNPYLFQFLSDSSIADQYDIWVVDFRDTEPTADDIPDTKGWNTWAFWQYKWDVDLAGGVADLNLFNGDMSRLQTFVISGGDHIPPTVDAFSVTHDSVTQGDSFTISYTVSDTGGSGLKQVELWRAIDVGGEPDWGTFPVDNPKQTTPLSGQSSYSGSFSDAPPSVGIYWYGLHVVDNAELWSVVPDPPGPIDVEVTQPIQAPQVTTNAATLVEETTATLNAVITNDGGEACQYRFEYDTNSGEPYAYSTGWTGSKTTGQSFTSALTSLSKGTKYYFRAQAKNSAGTASGSELTFLTKPDAPTSFSATTASTTQIDLSWSKGAGAQKTKIQGKQGSYPANRNDGTQVYFGTGSSTPDTGLTPGTTYYYRAWSYVQGSEQWSDNHAQDWATTTSIGAPTVTTNAATLVEETTATLNGVISSDGGEACQYRFEYDTNSGEPYAYNTGWTGSKTTGQSFNQALPSLNKGTKYYFRAQAKNSAGTASGSELTFLTKPDAPTSFSATTAGTTQIDLSWTKGAGAQKTRIQRKEGGYPIDRNDGTQVYFGTGSSTPATGLTPGTTYYYRAWSYVQGSEQWSDNPAQDWATTTSIGAPTVTTNAATNEGTDSAQLNGYLDDMGGANSCDAWFVWDTSYHSDYNDYGYSTSPQTKSSTGSFDDSISGLEPDTTYHFRAVASNSKGTNCGSDMTFTTSEEADTTPPTWGTMIGIQSATDTGNGGEVTVTYGTATDADSPPVKYNAYYSTSSPATGGTKVSNVGSSPYTATGLTNGQLYYFSVRAEDSATPPNEDTNTFELTATPTAPDSTPPSAVTDLSTINPTSNSIKLTWTAPGDDGNTGTATTYDIRYLEGTPITESDWASAIQCTDEPSPNPAGSAEAFVVTGLSPDTTYYFALKTADEVPNWSPISNSPSGKTEPEELPDLVISDKWLCWPDNCMICYKVTNIGDGTAPACHNTALYVDGVAVAHDHVPVDLAPGESYTGCFNGYEWGYTPPEDNITVCADSNNDVDEGMDESNNCLTNIWMCGDVNGDRAVNVIDVVLIYKRALDPGYPLDLPWAGDVNCDRNINVIDVVMVYKRALDPGYDLDCYCEVV